MLLLSYRLAVHNALAFYPETIAVMVQAGVAGALALVGLVSSRRQLLFLALSSAILGLLFLPWYYGGTGFPGGNDGGGMGWLILGGGGCLLSFVYAIIAVLLGCILRKQVPRSEPASG